MPKVSYVNGRYLNHSAASVHIEDRGYQFADGVYEVIKIDNRKLLYKDLHFLRLKHSLDVLKIPFSISNISLSVIISELIRRNKIKDGILYMQITRGVARRIHSFSPDLIPSLVMVIYSARSQESINLLTIKGVNIVTQEDLRWKRCDVKSISLLANILSKQYAMNNQAFESWLYNEEGYITEGSSSNSYIVTHEGIIVSHPSNRNILSGITRQIVLKIANKLNIKFEERPFSIAEALNAKEAFLTSTTLGIIPVVKIDEKVINGGVMGDITHNLLKNYKNYSCNKLI
ncbi:D-alanine aminotransferase [Rickettsiales bacterium Ac37b]|nr:D-alanine aminotransferase [Rickettsiales bacterium Ac37b]